MGLASLADFFRRRARRVGAMNKNNQRADLLLLLFSVFATAAANSVVFASMSELQEQYGYADSALGLIAGTGFAMGLLVQ